MASEARRIRVKRTRPTPDAVLANGRTVSPLTLAQKVEDAANVLNGRSPLAEGPERRDVDARPVDGHTQPSA